MNDLMTPENELQALRELQEWATKWKGIISGSDGRDIAIDFKSSRTTYFVSSFSYAERDDPRTCVIMRRRIKL